MRYIPVQLFFIFIWVMGGVTDARAFYPQGAMGMFTSNFSPYPPVLSQPIGILPSGFVTISVGDETFYYCNGIFYQKIMRDQKYVVVPPPIGAVVFAIPEGYQYLYMEGVSYYMDKGVYYKRTLEGYQVIYPPI